ncbi:hypothetical protein Droror1_Dr00023515 [Drosera rotundifolia]
MAAGEVLSGLKPKVALESGEMEEPVSGDVQILLTSKEDPISMRSLVVRSSTLLEAQLYNKGNNPVTLQRIIGQPNLWASLGNQSHHWATTTSLSSFDSLNLSFPTYQEPQFDNPVIQPNINDLNLKPPIQLHNPEATTNTKLAPAPNYKQQIRQSQQIQQPPRAPLSSPGHTSSYILPSCANEDEHRTIPHEHPVTL